MFGSFTTFGDEFVGKPGSGFYVFGDKFLSPRETMLHGG
jgi:hypothetical protein